MLNLLLFHAISPAMINYIIRKAKKLAVFGHDKYSIDIKGPWKTCSIKRPYMNSSFMRDAILVMTVTIAIILSEKIFFFQDVVMVLFFYRNIFNVQDNYGMCYNLNKSPESKVKSGSHAFEKG